MGKVDELWDSRWQVFWRLRLASGRPSFMTLTVAFALLVTPSFALLTDGLADPEALRRQVLEEANQALRREVLAAGFAPYAEAARSESARDASHALSLEVTHGVELLVANREFAFPLAEGQLRGRVPDAALVDRASRLLASELRRYPRDFFLMSRLRRVLLVGGLKQAGVRIPSLPNFNQALVLDVDSNPDFLRRLVHHEIFHFIDYAEDNQLKRDPNWERLNGPFFVYGAGGIFMREPGSARWTEALPGFLTEYSTSALEEDKAEVFSFMMIAPEAVLERSQVDPVLARKVDWIRARVARFSPSLGSILDSILSQSETG